MRMRLSFAARAGVPQPATGLPSEVVLLVLPLLPLDERLRAREVCRGWRSFLEDASFWTRVDLSVGCGVNPRFLTSYALALALLRAACVRAKGNLLSADLSGVVISGRIDVFIVCSG
jgi:hypothetical protein